MNEQGQNAAPGQQNYPSEQEPQGNPNAESAEEIVRGARNQDQLEKMKDAAPEGDEGKQTGAEPKAYQYERKTNEEESGEEDTTNNALV